MLKRVVITGIGGITALGNDWPAISSAFRQGISAVRVVSGWERFVDLNTRLGAPVTDFAPPAHWTRKQLRSMGRVAQLNVAAAEQALADAGLLQDERICDGRMGVACGSSSGAAKDVADMGRLLLDGASPSFSANTYIRVMPHTTAANVAIFFGLKGRVIPTSCACASV